MTGWGQVDGARVLLLGTGQHLPEQKSGLLGVPAVATTLADLRQVLIDRCGLPEHTITVLRDPASIEEMGEAVANAADAAEGLLVVYYVGHGIMTSARKLYLATANTITQDDRAQHTAMPYTLIAERVRNSPAHRRVVILDCCFSGGALDGAAGLGEPEVEPEMVANQTVVPGSFVLTSASRFQTSLAPAGSRHTAFTGALLRLLATGDPLGPPELTLGALAAGLVHAMQAQGMPIPRSRADGDTSAMVVADNPTYQPPPEQSVAPKPAARPTLDICPYAGLAPFDVGDARWFHGRKRLTGDLTAALAERFHGSGAPLAVIGGSGAGKSSLLRAGLLPAMRRGDLNVAGSASWPVRMFTPSTDPLLALADAVGSLAGTPSSEVADALLRDPWSIREMLRTTTRVETTARVLLVVDQFEDFFIHRHRGPVRSHEVFAAALSAAVDCDHGPPAALVVLGLRHDYYGHWLGEDGAQERPVIVPAMNSDEVRQAIELPARAAGLTLQDGLVQVLLADLGVNGADEPGRLPLLSHALRATWQRRKEGGLLTIAGYHDAGGITGALAHTADAMLTQIAERFGEEGTSCAEKLLIRLVHLTGDSDPARLRVTRSRLLSGLPDPVAAQVLEVLTSESARLISTGEETVEIVHEALLREWPWLRKLIDDQRSTLLVVGDLRVGAERWQARGRAVGGLLQGDELATARQRIGDPQHRDPLPDDAQEFLDASLRHHRRRQQARTAAAAALVGLLVLAVSGGGVALYQRNAANAAGRVALSRQLAAQSDALSTSNSDLAALLALQADAIDPTAEAVRSLVAARNRPLLRTLTGHAGPVTAVEFSRDGKRLATSATDGFRLWDADAGTPAATIAETGNSNVATFDGSGTRLVTAGPSGDAKLWNGVTGAPISVLEGDAMGAVFSPDDRWLASEGDDGGEVQIWNAETGATAGALCCASGMVFGVDFSPDGRRLVVAGRGDVQVWDLRRRKVLKILVEDLDEQSDAAYASFSPDGTRIITLDARGGLQLWDARGLSRLATIGQLRDDSALAVSPDGTRFATAGDPELWDLHTGAPISRLVGHTRPVTSAEFNPAGTMLATLSTDGTARLWDARTGAALAALSGYGNVLTTMEFSPDGTRIAVSGTGDNAVRMWDTRGGGYLRATFTGHIGEVTDMAFSPDGTKLVTGSADHTVRIWDALAGMPVDGLIRLGGVPDRMVFNADGSRIVTSNIEGGTRLWAMPAGRAVPSPSRDTLSMTPSPDGRLFATADARDSTVRIWDELTGEPIATLPTRDHQPALEFSGDSSRLVTSHLDGAVRVWAARNGKILGAVGGPADEVQAVGVSPDGNRIVLVGAANSVRIWDLRRPTASVLPDCSFSGGPSAALSPDGTRLVCRSADGPAGLWNTVDGKLITHLVAPADGGFQWTFSPDGTRMVTFGDGGIRLWDPRTGTMLSGLTDRSTQLAVFSPDGGRLATRGEANAVQLWDGHTGVPVATLSDSAGVVSSLVFSPDGTRLATAASTEPPDGQTLAGGPGNDAAQLWDAATGTPLATLTGHAGGVQALAFSPDNSRLASVDGGGLVRFWSARPSTGPAKQTVCRAVNRDLTSTEVSTYLPDDRDVSTCL